MKRPSDELIELIRRRSKRIRPIPTLEKERGNLPRRPRCVFFDVYGTLLVRLEDASVARRRRRRDIEGLIRRHNLAVTHRELDQLIRAAIAREHSAARAQGKAHPEVVIERTWAGLFPRLSAAELRRMIVEYELAAHAAWPMPGFRRILRSLTRSGMKLGIVSNAQFYTPLFLSALAGTDLPDLGFSPSLCLYSCDFEVAKPDQALFDIAVRRLQGVGIVAADALMVGNDCVNDTIPAALAGLMTVHAALDRRSSVPAPEGAGFHGPDAVIRRLAGLETLIEKAS